MKKLKTPLLQGEEIFMQHMATYLKGYPRPVGYLVVTNQRIFFEKSGGLNVASVGVLSLAMKDFAGVPLSEIIGVSAEGSIAGAGLVIRTRSNEEFKFALNGFSFSSKKGPRDKMMAYINSHINK